MCLTPMRGEPVSLPYAEPLTRIEPGPRVVPEPPRRGEPGGPPCGPCGGENEHTIWSDDHWILNHGAQTSLPGAVWLTTREHCDSFADLPPDRAREFGPLAGRIDRALLTLPDVARVHVYRWGDGGAHFHVWFLPRPLGMLEATKHFLPLWEEVLPEASHEAVEAAEASIAKAMAQG
jgi:diadenosine tetraphosphate (Ap4A) HIT family hydrolase